MNKTIIRQLAGKVFGSESLHMILDLIEEGHMKLVQRDSETMLETAQEEVLDSVYKGDCDFVLFDHYKHCRNFDNAVTQYIEENDTRS